MGSGASGLNAEQMSMLTNKIRDKYEECRFEDKTDDEMQKILTEEYQRCAVPLFEVQQPSEAPTKKLGISRDAIKNKLAAGSSKMNSGSTKSVSTKSSRTATRRKSFDTKKLLPTPENGTPGVTPDVSPPPTLDSADTAPNNNQASEVVDSWDSVSQQPFCKICQMAFKSMPFLERHVKYSDIHLKNVAAASGGNPIDAGLVGSEATPPPGANASMRQPRQVEGEDYKLIYSGSKFFWRTQDTVDFDIYYHIAPNVVEVISYDIVKSREMSRMYLHFIAMNDIITALGVQMPDEDTQRSAITTFLLQRLQLIKSAEGVNSINYVPLSGDSTTLKSPILEKPPLMLIPVPVVRRRRTNAEEIDATINSLQKDQQALAAATVGLNKHAEV